ncbi:hypothetical protein, partial [Burkholderia ubonensis]|uniref:hypothetical protein n=1 Tax=Burkholderia ubonensis TaxID=101571 RepID=UPI001E5C190C
MFRIPIAFSFQETREAHRSTKKIRLTAFVITGYTIYRARRQAASDACSLAERLRAHCKRLFRNADERLTDRAPGASCGRKKRGSSRITGIGGLDLEEEVGTVAVAVG